MSIFKINESRFLIFGLGTSGKGAIKLLEKYNCDYCVYDDDEEKLKEFDKDKISNCFELFDYVVVSPTVNVADKKANFISEIDLGFLFLKYLNIQATVIGVTGTCGKTTTVKMIENFLMSEGKRVAVAGNIGLSFCELLAINTNFDYLVLELSSFQLKNSLNVCCDYSIITNVTPNHLDIHNGYEDYFNSKLKLYDFTRYKTICGVAKTKIENCCETSEFDFLEDFVSTIKAPSFIIDKGEQVDYVLATRLASYLGIKSESCAKYIEKFNKPCYRFEIKGEVKGKTIINDSKSTCVGGTISALDSVHGSCCLIAGGRDKNVSYDELYFYLKNRGDVLLAVVGENANKLKRFADLNGFKNIVVCDTLTDAVGYAFNSECRTILFSPMAASFDLYSDYAARGKAFDDAVKQYERT